MNLTSCAVHIVRGVGGHIHNQQFELGLSIRLVGQEIGAFVYAIAAGMGTPGVEYLFAASINLADRAARKQGWQPHGRTGWVKPDGTSVCFICLEEQLAVVGKHATVYFVGWLSPQARRFECKWSELRA